jgi:hypothetical protein
MGVELVCRVCGIEFTAPRFDAKTCSSTCRSRLRRGGDLAYVKLLSKRDQRSARKMHAEWDAEKAAHAVYISPEGRDARRKVREQKAERERERLLDKIVGAAYRKAEREKELTAAIKTVAAFLKLFTEQRRNDFSAEAITAAIDDAVGYPLELVTAALAELKASGDYDRILAEPVDADA